MTEQHQTASILVVCTGNICRSPYAHTLLKTLVPGLEFSSAGTRAVVGAAIDPPVAEFLKTYDISDTSHKAQQLTVELIRAADLILTMTKEHRSAVISESPSALRKSVTVLEFARLVPHITPPADATSPAGKARAVPSLLGAARGSFDSPSSYNDDVVDPYRRSDDIYQVMQDQLDPALLTIARFFNGQQVTPPHRRITR